MKNFDLSFFFLFYQGGRQCGEKVTYGVHLHTAGPKGPAGPFLAVDKPLISVYFILFRF